MGAHSRRTRPRCRERTGGGRGSALRLAFPAAGGFGAHPPGPVAPKRILIATCTPALGAGLTTWIEAAEGDWEVSAIVNEPSAVVEHLATSSLSLVVASVGPDRSLAPAGGYPPLRSVPLLMLVSADSPAIEVDLLRAGAVGVLNVHASRSEFIGAVRALLAGRSIASTSALRTLVATPPSVPVLSPRQHQILRLLKEGRSTQDIAHQLVVTESTVKTHIKRIAARFDLSGRRELERRASELLNTTTES